MARCIGGCPFAIWFFLGIEGVANLAEEAINPKRTILLGFGSAIATLVILCMTTFTSSIGVAGWEPLFLKWTVLLRILLCPLALGHIVGTNAWTYQLFVAVACLV